MTTMLHLPEALAVGDVNVRTLTGWEKPHPKSYGPYYYRTDKSDTRGAVGVDPIAHVHHHTASAAYTPNRDKAQGWAGLSADGSNRLYQEDYGDAQMEPVYVVANAYPAPISTGYGDWGVWEKIKAGVEVNGRQGSDGKTAGNTRFWNTEWILDGTGSPVDQRVWDMMAKVSWITDQLLGWDHRVCNICHGHWTRRKIDLWAAQFSDTNRDGFQKTIEALRAAIEGMDNVPEYRSVLNVPDKDWARDVIDWGIDEARIINVTDNYVDDWAKLDMTDGRYWTFMERYEASLKRRGVEL